MNARQVNITANIWVCKIQISTTETKPMGMLGSDEKAQLCWHIRMYVIIDQMLELKYSNPLYNGPGVPLFPVSAVTE
jgi:hypothetical protein